MEKYQQLIILQNDLIKKIDGFSKLEKNWDSYNANKISKKAVETAKEIGKLLICLDIKIDFCVPMRDGGVQFEFVKNDVDYELEIDSTGSLHLLTYDEHCDLKSEKKLIMEHNLKSKTKT